MPSSCKELRAALAQCLQDSPCVMRDRHSAADCLRPPLVDDLPPRCLQLKHGLGECRRGMVDMRKRFRGNYGGLARVDDAHEQEGEEKRDALQRLQQAEADEVESATRALAGREARTADRPVAAAAAATAASTSSGWGWGWLWSGNDASASASTDKKAATGYQLYAGRSAFASTERGETDGRGDALPPDWRDAENEAYRRDQREEEQRRQRR